MVTTNDALQVLLNKAIRAGIVAIDTEFISSSTYYPRLSLIQIAPCGRDTELVDPLAAVDLALLKPLLERKDVIKVFHAPKADLQVLYQNTGARPRRIFDTQRAAAFAGLRYPVSLGNLVETLFGVTMDNSETRSNWLQRPLSQEQLLYAREDVRYLCRAHDILLQRCSERGHAAWLADEFKSVEHDEQYVDPDPTKAYLKFTSLHKYSSTQLTVLQAVAKWREEQAMLMNTPRPRILRNSTVATIARRMPKTVSLLQRMRGLAGTYGAECQHELLRIIRKARALAPDKQPPIPRAIPQDDEFKALVARAIEFIQERSDIADVAPNLVATKKAVRHHMAGWDSPLSHGWRHTFVGHALNELLEEERSEDAASPE